MEFPKLEEGLENKNYGWWSENAFKGRVASVSNWILKHRATSGDNIMDVKSFERQWPAKDRDLKKYPRIDKSAFYTFKDSFVYEEREQGGRSYGWISCRYFMLLEKEGDKDLDANTCNLKKFRESCSIVRKDDIIIWIREYNSE